MPGRKKQRLNFQEENGTVVKQSIDGQETFTLFYGRDCCFSNFFHSKFVIDGVEFNCTEQYFHYKKAVHFKDAAKANDILKSDNPADQIRLGRQVSNYDDVEWNRFGNNYMKEGLLAKFQQNEDLKNNLLKTVGTTLVEASPRDCKWGIGLGIHNTTVNDRKTWRGKNLLGQLLMEVRKEIQDGDDAVSKCQTSSD